jgi:hypothetical protein
MPGCRWKATPSAIAPYDSRDTRVPVISNPAAASDAVCGEAHGSGCHVSLGVAAERVEVDLAVSGLKPDWPPADRDRCHRAGRPPYAGGAVCRNPAIGRSR